MKPGFRAGLVQGFNDQRYPLAATDAGTAEAVALTFGT
jgi:hypothetical protein